MSQEIPIVSPDRGAEPPPAKWKGLYRIGAAASLGIALAYLLAMAVYLPAMREAAPPETVRDWFKLFMHAPLTGLFYLGLADVVIVILFGPVALALRAALARVSRTWTTLATPFAFVGMAVCLAHNVSFSMLSLSFEYTSARTEVERSIILAAGHAVISLTRGVANAAGLGLVWLAGLIFSALMFKSREFGRATAWIGVLAFALLGPSFLFAGYTYGVATGFGAAMALVTSIGGGLLSLAWYVLVAWRLLKLGRS